jgi:FkbH-like protein
LAKHVCWHALDGESFLVMHPLIEQRHVFDRVLVAILEHCGRGASTVDEIESALAPLGLASETLASAVAALRGARYLVPDDFDEMAAVIRELRRYTPIAAGHTVPTRMPTFSAVPVMSSDVGPAPRPTQHEARDIVIVTLGACTAHQVRAALTSHGPAYGLNPVVYTGWFNDLSLIEEHRPEVVILNPHFSPMTDPLVQGLATIDEDERRERVAIYKGYLGGVMEMVAAQCSGALLLLQGLIAPATSPFGRRESALEVGVRDMVQAVNLHMRDFARAREGVVFVDLDHVMSNDGRVGFVDDVVSLYSHMGPMAGFMHGIAPERRRHFPEALERDVLGRMAQENLATFVAWRRHHQIKLVVVDLDNTLWPGVAGDGAPAVGEWDAVTVTQPFAGLHEALGVLKARGVLLASASRNTEEVSLAHWRTLVTDAKSRGVPLLSPDDFVMHAISWEPKVHALAAILDALGIDQGAALFVDDHPVERAAAAHAFPRMRVMGEEIARVRMTLLFDPHLDALAPSAEARQRTETTKAKLERDRAMATAASPDDFLRTLGIELRITALSPDDDLGRIEELFARTNQFNLTLERYSARELRAILRDGGSLTSLAVRDRFGDYGTVGAVAIRDGEVLNCVISCRVLPLAVAKPFLATVLAANPAGAISGTIVDGPRNQPGRSIYRELGFARLDDGRFLLERQDALPAVDTTTFAIVTGALSSRATDRAC